MRSIPLPGWVIAALRKHKRGLAEERLAAGEAYSPTDLLAVSELGEPVLDRTYSNTFKRLAAEAGVRG